MTSDDPTRTDAEANAQSGRSGLVERLRIDPTPQEHAAWHAVLFGNGSEGAQIATARLLGRALATRSEAASAITELADALRGLVEAVVRDSNEHGISGYTGARLSDARAALAKLEAER